MNRGIPSRLVVAGISLLLAVGVSAGDAGNGPPPRTVGPQFGVSLIAIDGPRVAYAGGAIGIHCPRIFVWNVWSRQQRAVSHLRTCNVAELAVARKRVAWIVRRAGNTEWNDKLYVSSLPTARERLLASTERYAYECSDDPRCMSGTWAHGLVGSGRLLAVGRWTTDTTGGVQRVTNGGLDVIGAHGLRRIVVGRDGIVSASADSGKVAVLRPTGTIGELITYRPERVAVYSGAGRLLKELTPAGIELTKGEQMAQIALSGTYLAVLTVEPRLELYNWRTGALIHSRAVPVGAGHLVLSGQIAAYLVTHYTVSLTLHVVQARTGRDVVLGRFKARSRSGFADVDIDALGLVYAAYRTPPNSETLVFVPMARVKTALAGRR